MAHVLLPCDLPSWKEVQGLLSKMRANVGVGAAAQLMQAVHEICSVSLDPDDSGPVLDHPGFERLAAFLVQEEKETGNVLADVADWASRLSALKPANGLHYSLRTQEGTLNLDRPFVASLLANAIFSTFPRRKAKTHPTLQDFRMAEFFTHLDRDVHRKRLRTLLRYFENLEPEPDGTVRFTRKVFRGPTLPGWLCSERPLVPLVVRPQGSLDEAEPWVFRGCSCNSAVGGDVLGESQSQESSLFFECPELMSCLCFLESLVDQEALLVEGVRAPDTQEVNFCFVDVQWWREDLVTDDVHLLRCLNKAAAAFAHEPRLVDRRRTPDGGESSSGRNSRSEARESRMETAAEKLRRVECCPKTLLPSTKRRVHTSVSQASSKFSMRTASESSGRPDEEYFTADEDSESESASNRTGSGRRTGSSSRRHTEEESESEQVPRPPSSQGSFGFVLGGGSEEESESVSSPHERLEDFRRRIRRRTRRKPSRRRTSPSYSSGGGASSGSDMEDIGEEDREEEEDCRHRVTVIRPACSEPSLLAAALLAESDSDLMTPSWVNPEALVSLPGGQKQLAAATCGGHLKAYSHDGVRPNLPVPFRARFRNKNRRASEGSSEEMSHSLSEDKEWTMSRCPVAVSAGGEDPQLRALVLWLAASMAQLPALILYTMNEPALQEVIPVYKQILNRQWTVGDLACEVLRFCRNRSTPGHRTGKHSQLFGQLMADRNVAEERAIGKVFKDESLD